jgi:uncharacterized RmlC-like cupin family protein
MGEDIRVMTEADLQPAAATPGIERNVAFEGDDHWFGHVEAAPETMSGWHHHGRHVTLGYVLEGVVHLEYGPNGQEHVDVREGDYFMVPPGVVHREGNATKEPGKAVLMRFGEGPPVFPVEGPQAG